MMKLLTKLNIRYIIYSIVVMVISAVAIYAILSIAINEQMDEQLSAHLKQIESQLAKYPRTVFFEPFTEITRTDDSTESKYYSDTLIYNQQEHEYEEYRQIVAAKNIGGSDYRISIRKSKIESEDLLETLALVTVLALLLLTATLILVNRKVALSVWKEFYFNLERVKNFSLIKQEKLNLQTSGIKEFNELNTILESLTNKLIDDYKNLKQFTEDASHEMQTPLAIIRSKLETILNETGLSRKQTDAISTIFSATSHLARLNKSLILLSKLDNKQFTETSEVSFKELLIEKITDWQELMALKQIKPNYDFQNDLKTFMNPVLAEALISNLLSNAINHTKEGGSLTITIEKKQLIFSNSGDHELTHPSAVFNRFYKENSSSNSLGLGLAIVKKICENYGVSIVYSFENRCHKFTLNYN